ncbi:hypothetical protein MSAN_00488600 [Mycena sanguinolenta]|uniref:CFEM domain-containing protein n=1 Tax=Mycena sanguinolenta TaxID=230812 RepID=A0A8H6Z9J9_9AGAR|nr:hypothetical protein MSAN_00488600 [Mycena sanguinolenta]
MKGPAYASSLPATIVGVHKRGPLHTLTPCASTCHDEAMAAGCTPGCQCVGAEFQFRWFSCMQGECQAAELDSAHQYLKQNCGTVSPTGTPTATTSFLPPNAQADINDSTQTAAPTSSSARNTSSSGGSLTATSNSSTPTETNQTVHSKNGAPTVAIAASIAAGILIGALIIFIFRARRRKQIRAPMVPEQFLESKSGVEHTGRSAKLAQRARRVNWVQEAVSDDAPTSTRADPGNEPSSDTGEEEPMALRMRRLEAQVGALLAESTPPSYSD